MTEVQNYFLDRGKHRTAAEGRCAMEWVAFLAGEEHSDSPACVSPLLMDYCISLNDALEDKRRQQLRPLLARTIGTAGDGLDPKRSQMAWDWILRIHLPTWLDLAGLPDPANALRSSGINALTMAWNAAWDATAVAHPTLHPSPHPTAAWDATAVAAWDAARDADAAWGAAGIAARDAAWRAAGIAARDANAAKTNAKWDVLRSTLYRLQDSAISLLDQMLPTEPLEIPTAVVDEHIVREPCYTS